MDNPANIAEWSDEIQFHKRPGLYLISQDYTKCTQLYDHIDGYTSSVSETTVFRDHKGLEYVLKLADPTSFTKAFTLGLITGVVASATLLIIATITS